MQCVVLRYVVADACIRVLTKSNGCATTLCDSPATNPATNSAILPPPTRWVNDRTTSARRRLRAHPVCLSLTHTHSHTHTHTHLPAKQACPSTHTARERAHVNRRHTSTHHVLRTREERHAAHDAMTDGARRFNVSMLFTFYVAKEY